MNKRFFNTEMETLPREDIDKIIEERIRYTVSYAEKNSPFYKSWLKKHNITSKDIKTHEDLRELPIISSETIRKNQPPETDKFEFKSSSNTDIFTIHETSGTSGIPKSFFLTWEDWEHYAEKYARAFVSQGFGKEDTVIVCTSYGKNVGANTMTLAARNLGMTIIPEGKCSFPSKMISKYRPTGIVGNIFKLLRLARRFEDEGINPSELGLKRLVTGGEAFAEESRTYLEDIWGAPVYNIYGSTEGTMCGECYEKTGLHVPEDMVHLDVYDPEMKEFVADGECGRMVLTTLLPVGSSSGTLLLNYDTEDTSVVLTRKKCACGRTHMKITNPQRESETIWIEGSPINRVDVERGIFQKENLDFITGEYESILKKDSGRLVLEVSVESFDPKSAKKGIIEENFTRALFENKPILKEANENEKLDIEIEIKGIGELDLYKKKIRVKRLIDNR
jgi:coenzyme F390 synthetase